jgi:hypothetical protein
MTESYIHIVPYSHKTSTRKLYFSFILHIKYVAVTLLHIYNLIIRESLPTCVLPWNGRVQFIVDGLRGMLPNKKSRELLGYIIYTGQTFVYLQCNFSYEIRKLPWRIKTCNTNRRSDIQRMEMENVQVTAVRQEIVNHSLLVKALIQVLVFLLCSLIKLWGMHILGGYIITLPFSSTTQT